MVLMLRSIVEALLMDELERLVKNGDFAELHFLWIESDAPGTLLDWIQEELQRDLSVEEAALFEQWRVPA